MFHTLEDAFQHHGFLTITGENGEKEVKEVILFFSKHSVFSNFYPVKGGFNVDGVTYCCVEKYFQAFKARHFGDMDACEKIMVCTTGKEMQAIGRKVVGFNPEEWLKVCDEVLFTAQKAKFSSPSLKGFLENTGDALLVESSPYDKRYGVGKSILQIVTEGGVELTLENNYCGRSLMKVREFLRGG